ncbi:MAG: hypothetical protein ACOYXB_11050 [Bacteroidota bacterium]
MKVRRTFICLCFFPLLPFFNASNVFARQQTTSGKVPDFVALRIITCSPQYSKGEIDAGHLSASGNPDAVFEYTGFSGVSTTETVKCMNSIKAKKVIAREFIEITGIASPLSRSTKARLEQMDLPQKRERAVRQSYIIICSRTCEISDDVSIGSYLNINKYTVI